MHQVNTTVAVAGFVVVLLGLASVRLESLPISRSLIALGIGVVAGPEILDWIEPQDWTHEHVILKEAARFTLAISVFGIALRTPREDYMRLLRPVGLLLTFGMLIMWLVSAGLACSVLGLSPLMALLLARREALFLGWFGPIGVAAVYYALLAQERMHDPLHWHAASLVIALSILAHGVTSAPALAAYRRASDAWSTGPDQPKIRHSLLNHQRNRSGR